MEEKRKEIVTAYLRGDLKGLSNPEIENMFGIQSGAQKGDKIRQILKAVKNKDNQPPGKQPDLTLKSEWETQGKGGKVITLRSYTNNVTRQDIDTFRAELIEEIKKHSPRKPFKPDYRNSRSMYGRLLLISIPDYHVGREDAETTKALFLGVLAEILEEAAHYVIDHIIFVIGNDWFNSDHGYTTTKGTPQFDFQEWKETWKLGRDILIESIEMLKQKKCPITIINVLGNHDTQKIFFLGDLVDAWYRNDEQVMVDNSSNEVKAFKYGQMMLAFEHGELKTLDYPSIMATDYPEIWGTTKYREMLCGHIHHEVVSEHRGAKVRFLPSLAKHSDWEKRQGYRGSPQAQGYVYDKERGLKNIIQINL